MRSSDPIEMAVKHPSRRVAFQPMKALLHAVADAEGVSIDTLSVVFTDHATVERLNRRHLGRAYRTDVLAFDLRANPGDGPVDGEIYIDLDTAAERAPEFRVSYTDEVRRYAVHGLLHLIGYQDDTDKAKAEMQKREDGYLREFRGR